MHDAGFVSMIERHRDLRAQLGRSSRSGLLCSQPIGQRGSLHVIADNVDRVVRSPDFMHRDDARVLQLRCRACLAEKLFGFFGGKLLFAWDLDGDLSV